jgi:hypothetical protein
MSRSISALSFSDRILSLGCTAAILGVLFLFPSFSAAQQISVSSQLADMVDPPEISEPEPGEASPETVSIDTDSVGAPYVEEMLDLLNGEITSGINSRRLGTKYQMFRSYAGATLNSTSSTRTGSEVDGRGRLSWYEQLYRDPLAAVAKAEKFSRRLHAGFLGNHRVLAENFAEIRRKLDVAPREDGGVRFARVDTPEQAINEVRRCLKEAQSGFARAVAPLSPSELSELSSQLYTVYGSQGVNGHTLPNRSRARRLLHLMEKMDRRGIHDAAEAMIPLTEKRLLEHLGKIPEDNALAEQSEVGPLVRRIITPAGEILIGGRGDNHYPLDQLPEVVCVIDLGGNDTYSEGICTLNRPVLTLIDLAGNDTYTASKPGVQGGSILGVSFLHDLEGDDRYSARDVAQGSTLGGAGILIDQAGTDSYSAMRRAQGHALGGMGLLIDHQGNDKYHAALWAQGLGNPRGFGVLEDAQGNDTYYLGGLYLDSYDEHPGYDGWGQGLGAGLRQVANGGIGVLLDGGGDDLYEFDYIAHGGGYWLGVGIARDFGGNDQRLGATRLAYNGQPRSQSRWQRFGVGFGCHYALGFLFDDQGDDSYDGTIMSVGMAWDLSIGGLFDFEGDDKYLARGGLTQGTGAEGSIGILFDYFGDDVFQGRGQGYASSNISYHSPSQCGSNFSFFVNYGGKDQYGCRARNDSVNTRGSYGGFLIDRPLETEIQTAEGENASSEKQEATAASKLKVPANSQ